MAEKKSPYIKLKAHFIIESEEETCLICKKSKGGSFLVIYLEAAGYKKYLSVCRECLEK